ncbi:hypothetical protein Sru01_52580 [Sphaerisporangium rufum]|uniref:Winged helix DNA-binding domain-containing protein n=1 Tax=Sphaerisporangium rufum TaxID=1381558 RepID=A0A919V0N6_9ACTN|nr:winged helix DNA-binding domain-containing protein [Sphaerisporangium rufum]GII80276.1 hypothetical protein Sru01_52580 [Sphaerisporangium rufum]
MIGPREIALLRLAAQGLAGPGEPTPAAAVRRLAAMQAQERPGALTSVALRTAGGTREAVLAALDAGEAVTSWPMRGTLHLVPAEDLRWMLELTGPRQLAVAARRRAELELDEAALDRAREVAVAALSGGGRLRRAELYELWTAAGVPASGSRGYHLLGHLAQTGTVCFGPAAGGEQLVVLVAEWIPRPRRPEREEALGELAERYFRGHGPATARDFARWTGLLAADVRAGLALARPRLARLEVDGVEHLMAPETPDLLAAHRDQARGTFLLPGFDELLLGYADRTAVLPAEFAGRIVPGGNGIFQPTVVDDGQVVGTWRHAGRAGRREPAFVPFTGFRDGLAATLAEVYAALP